MRTLPSNQPISHDSDKILYHPRLLLFGISKIHSVDLLYTGSPINRDTSEPWCTEDTGGAKKKRQKRPKLSKRQKALRRSIFNLAIPGPTPKVLAMQHLCGEQKNIYIDPVTRGRRFFKTHMILITSVWNTKHHTQLE